MKTKHNALPLPVGLFRLDEWAISNAPDESKSFHRSYWQQIVFVRDRLYPLMASMLGYDRYEAQKLRPRLHGTHVSKSIKLPVFRIDLGGMTFKIRCNLHDWCVVVWGADGLKLPDYMQEASTHGYYEGIEVPSDNPGSDELIPSHRLCVGNQECLYAIMWWFTQAPEARAAGKEAANA